MTFDEDTFSWRKGDVVDSDAANEQTIVPFAVDLREHNRWVAFATTARIQPSGFRFGLEHALNAAIALIQEIPTDWEVDLVTSRALINDWLRRNSEVFELTRTIKFSNPGLDLEDEKQQMRRMRANRKTEQFRAPYGRALDTSTEDFQEKLDGTQTGDTHVRMEARGRQSGSVAKFNSDKTIDTLEVADFGGDPENGIEPTLGALRDYVAAHDDGDEDGDNGSPTLMEDEAGSVGDDS